MAPNPDLSDESLTEMVSSLRSGDTKVILTVMITQFGQFKELLGAKDKEIVELRREIGHLKGTLAKLSDNIDEESAYERRDTILLSGKPIPHGTRDENVFSIVKKVIKDKVNINITPGDINCAHRIGKLNRNGGQDKRPIIVKLVRRSLKRDIIVQSRNLQRNVAAADRLYITESLTPKRRTILDSLKKMRKMEGPVVTGCTSLDGSVCAYTKSTTEGGRDRRHTVNTHQQLVQFCDEFVEKPLHMFLDNWRF